MNLFKFHDEAIVLMIKPFVSWEKHKGNINELKKREKLWARDPSTAYCYAKNVLNGQFLGEQATAKDEFYSYMYYLWIVLYEAIKAQKMALEKDENFDGVFVEYTKGFCAGIQNAIDQILELKKL